MMARGGAILTVVTALASSACSRGALIEIAMASAERPEAKDGALRVGRREILAGDMHCHVAPPDSPTHASRDLAETLALAERERLDFVVLAPHVRSRFFANPAQRAAVTAAHARLAQDLERLRPSMLVVRGLEYTDYAYGHVGMSFADVGEIASMSEPSEPPTAFFERWVARGGLLTINHPVERPIPGAPFSILRHDLSWRAFAGAPVPDEIAWITAHAHAIETFNVSITRLRDPYFFDDEDRSLREASHLVDRQIRAERRRIAPVGGTDSHEHWLRASTFVLVESRTIDGLRDGIAGGRTCVRDPSACTLEVRPLGGEYASVGDAITTDASADPEIVEARARGGPITFFVNGASIAPREIRPNAAVRIAVPRGRCALVRAIVGRGYSAPIYVNCPFVR